jgi:uncharacterized spore protein YtfJ
MPHEETAMTDESTQAAYDDAEAMASKIPGLLEGLAERLGTHAGAKAVFGDPVERDGLTVIPVAQSMIGTGAGGGGGTDQAQQGSGVGAGGGAMTRPVGYIEISSAGAVFKPLAQPWTDVKLVLAYSLIALVAARMVVKLIRG